MTVYREIPDSEIAPDAPVLSDTAVALRDNIVAIFEGDGSAPKITPAAMLAPTAGDTIIWRSHMVFESDAITSNYPVIGSEANVLIAGTVRVTFDYSQSVGGTPLIELKKNGTVVFSTSSGAGSASVDVGVSLGDSIYINISSAQSYTITNYRIKSGVSTAAIA